MIYFFQLLKETVVAAAAVVVVVAESMTTDRKLILHDLSVEGMYKSYKEKTFLGICVVKKIYKNTNSQIFQPRGKGPKSNFLKSIHDEL